MLFNKIIGHDLQKSSLKRAFDENRVAHSYIFSGPDGVGKKLVALEFAKLLNCLKYQSNRNLNREFDSCSCASCRKIANGIHPDVFVVEYRGVKDIKIEQVREEIEERLYLKAYEGRFKVAIVDEAERLNLNAQNAFLKTLEEPPPDSVIILITSNPQSLIPTILSRCQNIQFRGLPEGILTDEISKFGDFSREEAVIISRLSNGSIGKARSVDKVLISDRKKFITKLSRTNTNFATSIYDLLSELPLGSSPEDSERLKFYFEVILQWLRDLVLIKIGFGDESVLHRDLIPLSREYAGQRTLDKLLEKMRVLEDIMVAIFRGNANKQLALENLIFKIAD
ncbi:MAG: ATP-binding protein [Thermodesulfobacteriota bacterium]